MEIKQNVKADKKREDAAEKKSKETVKNRLFGATMLAGMGTAVWLALCPPSCCVGKKQEIAPPVPMCEGIRGDGFCDQCESYPYLREGDGKVRMDGGKPVPNPSYSKEDCYYGDGVCDSAKEASGLKDPAGNPAQLSKAMKLPLENENSIDCAKELASKESCALYDPAKPALTRPLVTKDYVSLRRRQVSQKELENLKAHPELLTPGNNYFDIYDAYEETCDSSKPLCTSESKSACACPNHEKCAPKEPAHCGNGKIEREYSEICDPGSKKTNVCPPGPEGKKQACDKITCQCKVIQIHDKTHAACNADLECVQMPGPGKDECGPSKPCKEEEEPRPQPSEDLPKCKKEVGDRLKGYMSNSLTRGKNLEKVRESIEAGASDVPKASVSYQVLDGKAETTGISVKCSGSCGKSSVTLEKDLVNLEKATTGIDGSCKGAVDVEIPPG